jgi:hypothetical protein
LIKINNKGEGEVERFWGDNKQVTKKKKEFGKKTAEN